MAVTVLPKPVWKIALQTDDGWYSLVLDNPTAGLVLVPGAGVGTLMHNGSTYEFRVRDAAAINTSADAPYAPDAATYNPDAPFKPDAP